MPIIYEVNFGRGGWQYTFELLKERLRDGLHEFNEMDAPSESYKAAYTVCINMLMGKYWTDNDYEWRQEEESVAFFMEFRDPFGSVG